MQAEYQAVEAVPNPARKAKDNLHVRRVAFKGRSTMHADFTEQHGERAMAIKPRTESQVFAGGRFEGDTEAHRAYKGYQVRVRRAKKKEEYHEQAETRDFATQRCVGRHQCWACSQPHRHSRMCAHLLCSCSRMAHSYKEAHVCPAQLLRASRKAGKLTMVDHGRTVGASIPLPLSRSKVATTLHLLSTC